jgi:hypothetical protein
VVPLCKRLALFRAERFVCPQEDFGLQPINVVSPIVINNAKNKGINFLKFLIINVNY